MSDIFVHFNYVMKDNCVFFSKNEILHVFSFTLATVHRYRKRPGKDREDQREKHEPGKYSDAINYFWSRN